MKFGKRLRLYLFGFGIGILFVVVVFNQRLSLLTSWMPENRIQYRLLQTNAEYTPKALCQLNCLGLDTSDVRLVKTNGKVRYRLSETRQEPKIYVFDSKLSEGEFRLTFEANDSSSILINTEQIDLLKTCPCDAGVLD